MMSEHFNTNAYRCQNCRSVFTENAAVRETDGTVRCPECKHVVDFVKCCKTCANWQEAGCTHFELWQEDGDIACEQSNAVIRKLFDREKGPPWPNCRGWAERK